MRGDPWYDAMGGDIIHQNYARITAAVAEADRKMAELNEQLAWMQSQLSQLNARRRDRFVPGPDGLVPRRTLGRQYDMRRF